MRINAINTVTAILATLSVCVLVSTVYFLTNIKVIDEWTLTLPQQEIHVGDTVVVQSTYHKLREVGGESVRYIQCQNRNGIWIRYELNRATANRQAGRGGTGLVLTVRRDIADVPTKCKFTVAIRYDVLPFRKVYVSNDTKDFMLLPERATPQDVSDEFPAATPKSPSPVASISPAVSSTQTTPTPQVAQPNSSQATAQPANEDTPQSLLQMITAPIRNTIGGVL